MRLTDTKIRHLKPKAKIYRLNDGDGLYLVIKENGRKTWAFRYTLNHHSNWLGLGAYPEVSLQQARTLAQEYRTVKANGVDPQTHKQSQQALKKQDNRFEAIAKEWYELKSPEWSVSHQKRTQGLLERSLLPHLKHKNINEITPVDIINVLKKLEQQGHLVALTKARQLCSQIFKYAITLGKCYSNPCSDISGVFRVAKEKPYAHFKRTEEIADLLKRIDRYHGYYQTKMALIIAPTCF